MPRSSLAIPGLAATTRPRCRSCRRILPVRQNGSSIRIDYVNINNISIDYEITVPEETAIRAHTGSGNQTIEGLRGNIELESGSGDLKLARLTGDMRFQTGSGNVRGRELAGPAKIKAGSGDIEIEETGVGDMEIRTGSGNINVRGINGGFHAEAGSGDIHGKGVPKSMWSVRTGSGNVTLSVPTTRLSTSMFLRVLERSRWAIL